MMWLDELMDDIDKRFTFPEDRAALYDLARWVANACDQVAPGAPKPRVCAPYTCPGLDWITPGPTEVVLTFYIQNTRARISTCEFGELFRTPGGPVTATLVFDPGNSIERIRRFFEEYPEALT